MRPPARTATPPGDLQGVIAAADTRGRALYGLVRRLVDELEDAAPWTLLYAPPLDLDELRARTGRLLELVKEAPRRIASELDSLTTPSAGRLGREAREEAEFYFSALHQMTAPDRRLLGAALDKLPIDAPLSRSGADYLCELAADLKGAYSSAIMGAAAALVSDGRWLGVEVETTLFPEKAEERVRNRELLTALTAAAQALAAVRLEFPWQPILASWRARRQVDRYALSALVSLRPHLLLLLSITNRRALYSGDYHLLQRREALLGERLRELEELHLGSLDLAPDAPEETTGWPFARLGQLLLEIAALLDVEVLRGLIGDAEVRRLRAAGARSSSAHGASPELEPMARLLGEEDLTIFLQLLLGAVTKRLSIAFETGGPAGIRPVEAQPEARPQPKAAPRRGIPGPAHPDTPAARRLAATLATTLARLSDPAHDPWRAFQMVHKLQARLRVLPPTLMAETLPFLAELRGELLPLLEEAGALDLLPAAAAETLRSCDQRLSGRDLTRPETSLEVGNDLARVIRLLDSLAAAGLARRSSAVGEIPGAGASANEGSP